MLLESANSPHMPYWDHIPLTIHSQQTVSLVPYSPTPHSHQPSCTHHSQRQDPMTNYSISIPDNIPDQTVPSSVAMLSLHQNPSDRLKHHATIKILSVLHSDHTVHPDMVVANDEYWPIPQSNLYTVRQLLQ